MNFKNFGNEPLDGTGGGGAGRPPENFPLARQSSVYSLTFDEFQSTMGGIGKDFGSMNMDELLKNIWCAEETQTMGAGSAAAGQEGIASCGYLQRQGSLTLPRTLSQKKVDEVWKDIARDYGGRKDEGSEIPQRQQTLGEMTLEEFLVRAGAVNQDIHLGGKPNNYSFYGDLSRPNNYNAALGIGFQQINQDQVTGLLGNRILDASTSSEAARQTADLPPNVNGVRPTEQQLLMTPQQPPQNFPKQPRAYANPVPFPASSQLGSPGIRGGVIEVTGPSVKGNFVPNSALRGGGKGMMVGLGAGAVTVAIGSPTVSSDGVGRGNGDSSYVLPAPYMFNGGLRGRKPGNVVEKVVERRQRRMIKNRESAARSRARKQAYTTELEEEVAKLKEENQELLKKQEEIMVKQKNQVVEMKNMEQGNMGHLKRTHTGPW